MKNPASNQKVQQYQLEMNLNLEPETQEESLLRQLKDQPLFIRILIIASAINCLLCISIMLILTWIIPLITTIRAIPLTIAGITIWILRHKKHSAHRQSPIGQPKPSDTQPTPDLSR